MTYRIAQITFRGLTHAGTLDAGIHERVNWLQSFYPGMMRCRVLVELPHRHHRRGRHFHVRIEVTVPGHDPIVVSHQPSLHHGLRDLATTATHKDAEIERVHRNAAVAIRGAFDAARRLLDQPRIGSSARLNA